MENEFKVVEQYGLHEVKNADSPMFPMCRIKLEGLGDLKGQEFICEMMGQLAEDKFSPGDRVKAILHFLPVDDKRLCQLVVVLAMEKKKTK